MSLSKPEKRKTAKQQARNYIEKAFGEAVVGYADAANCSPEDAESAVLREAVSALSAINRLVI